MGTVLWVVSVSVSVSLLLESMSMHDPVVRISPFVPFTGAEESTMVAFGPPAHICHTAGGRLDIGKPSARVSAEGSLK